MRFETFYGRCGEFELVLTPPAGQVMRTKDSDEQVKYLKQASDADTLDDIFTGLDVLGSLAWKINRPVFEVVSTVWNTGEELADIPSRDSLARPLEADKPSNVESDPRAKDSYRHRIRKALQERRAAHSNRCDVNYKLEIGRAVRCGFCAIFLSALVLTRMPISFNSFSTRLSTSLTTSISEDVPTLSLPIFPTSVTTCVEVSSSSPKRSLWAIVDFDGSRFIWPTCRVTTKLALMNEKRLRWSTWRMFTIRLITLSRCVPSAVCFRRAESG